MITKVDKFIAEKKRKIEESKNIVATTSVNEAQEKINEQNRLIATQLSKLVEEGHIKPEQTVEQILELFGTGKKTYVLDDKFTVDPKIDAVIKQRSVPVKSRTGKVTSLVQEFKDGFTRVGLVEPELSKAVQALWTFVGADSVPQMDKYNYTYNNDTKQLVIDPNGKGLFNGHPIMG
jgi:hypothetical protein